MSGCPSSGFISSDHTLVYVVLVSHIHNSMKRATLDPEQQQQQPKQDIASATISQEVASAFDGMQGKACDPSSRTCILFASIQ